jgi:hypothetical protein
MARSPHRYHYIYKITCLKNERYYIGMHSTSDLDDGYMGGGLLIKKSIKKHGKEKHFKEILEFLPDRDSLIRREIQIINEDILNDPLCMNINKGGEGGWKKEWSTLGAISANKKNWENPEFREKMKTTASSTLKRLWDDPEKRTKLLETSKKTFEGRNHQEEAKRKMSVEASKRVGQLNSQFGTYWVTKLGVDKKIKSFELDDYLSLGWKRGRKGTASSD